MQLISVSDSINSQTKQKKPEKAPSRPFKHFWTQPNFCILVEFAVDCQAECSTFLNVNLPVFWRYVLLERTPGFWEIPWTKLNIKISKLAPGRAR